MLERIEDLLGEEAEAILSHTCVFPKEQLHLPGSDFVDRILVTSDRNPAVLRNLQNIFDHGRLLKTGYLSRSSAARVNDRTSHRRRMQRCRVNAGRVRVSCEEVCS